MTDTNVYTQNGYKDRHDYLKSLAEEFEIPYKTVAACASMLGPDEDFDGLVTQLEDELGW
jgi:hypothetical protein